MNRDVDAAEFVDYWGNSIASRIVDWRGHKWYAKTTHGPAWREVLAFRLGRSWLNVAEVASGDQVMDAEWASGGPIVPYPGSGIVLVRLGQDHSAAELPLHNLESAIAFELAFSIWIRRRDAHAWNRAYVEGVPVFYDHHIAFGAEHENVELDSFFRPGPDPGWAGTWRVQQVPNQEFTPTTLSERGVGRPQSIHRVRNLDAFDQELDLAAERIRQFDSDSIRREVDAVEAEGSAEISALLIQTRDELDAALRRLRSVVYAG